MLEATVLYCNGLRDSGIPQIAGKPACRDGVLPYYRSCPQIRTVVLTQNEPSVLSTRLRVPAKIASASGAQPCIADILGCLRISGTLPPLRPSGRHPHRPLFLSAEHVRQLGGASPLHNVMDVK